MLGLVDDPIFDPWLSFKGPDSRGTAFRELESRIDRSLIRHDWPGNEDVTVTNSHRYIWLLFSSEADTKRVVAKLRRKWQEEGASILELNVKD